VSTARKTVTILFSDVTGSTALGEEIDPESLREVIQRYFTEMRAVIERHCGTVEKFIGDAVMAVFGVPQVHEDDALWAVRAAIDMQSALDALNVEIERGWGTGSRRASGWLARRSVDRAWATDYSELRGLSQVALAEVLHESGRTEEAAEALRRAVAAHETKGNVVSAATTRQKLEDMQAVAPKPGPTEA
jgi:class 3 adenylate cyclase